VAPLVVVVVVGIVVVVAVVVSAIALPPLRLSAVEISMGAMFSTILYSSPPVIFSSAAQRVLQTFAQLLVDLVSLIVTVAQIAFYMPSPSPSLNLPLMLGEKRSEVE